MREDRLAVKSTVKPVWTTIYDVEKKCNKGEGETHFLQFPHHVAHFLLFGCVDERRKRRERFLHDSLVCDWEIGQFRE